MKILQFQRYAILTLSSLALLYACSKSDGGPDPVPDPCSGVTIAASATTTNTNACLNSGSITVTATGSANLSYSIDGSNFQSSNVFSNVAKGTYTVTVKNGSGCSKTVPNVAVNENSAVPGPLFTEVKQMMQLKCVTCHAPGGQQPTPNFTVDCNIVINSSNIRNRAVVLGTMPPTGPLSQSEKDKITAWVNAGGTIDK